MRAEVEFLRSLHADLAEVFDDEMVATLTVAAAAELFASPRGVVAMLDRYQPNSKEIAAKRMPK